MNVHRNLPLVSRETAVAMTTPVIPLNFVYPGLSLAQILSIAKAYWKLSLLIALVVLILTAVAMVLLIVPVIVIGNATWTPPFTVSATRWAE